MSVVDPDDPRSPADSSGSAPAHDPRLDALLDAIARGRPIDWPKVQAELQFTDSEIEPYRILAGVAAVNRDADGAPATANSSASLGHVLAAASTQPPIDPATAGTPWGPLRKLDRIGGGHFGDVYRAYYPELDTTVALKILRAANASTAARHRAAADGRLLAKIRHPNVVTVHGAGEFDGEVGVWMDFIQGRTLDYIVQHDGPFSGSETLTIGECLCDALAAAHQQEVLHRDIKAENVMRETGGTFVLLDFGIGADIVTPDGAGHGAAGTPLYMAPELFRGARASVQTDIYSLGVLLFYLVTGTFPVFGRTYAEMREQHANRSRVRLADVRAGLPRQLLHIVEKATAYDPADRYASAGAMLADFGVRVETAAPAWRTPIVAVGSGLLMLAIGPYLLGQLTTTNYNVALGRGAPFGQESLVEMWEIGRRLVVLPLLLMVVSALTWRVLCACGRRTIGSSLVPRPLRGVIARSTQAVCRICDPAAPFAVDMLLAMQVGVAVAICWSFAGVLVAATANLAETDPELLAPLRYGGYTKHLYLLSLCASILATGTGWTRLLAKRGVHGIGVVNTGVGVALLTLLIVLVALPYRLIFMNESRRADYMNMRCFITDAVPREKPEEYLLYCPDAPGKKVRIVPPGPDLILRDERENIFTPDESGATPDRRATR